ncbi:MAG: hypothetical protein QOF06_1858 [Solirubrobacterales bacterium]|jgi:hypothetical protein|nr:hypothetical protein [Solirubrobacterales bacterium]
MLIRRPPFSTGQRRRDVVVVIGTVVLVLLFVVLVIKVLPERLASTAGLDAKAKAEEVGRTRTATLALLAGGIALIGAVYTARTFSLNRRGQITDRFIRGIEQLGNESLDMRVGAIYVLDSVAHESRREHGPVMETLAAFIRQRSLPRGQANDPGRFPPDIRAAMTVIERRDRESGDDESELDLRYANLSYLRLESGADLRGLNFEGATLDHAHLSGADLRGANLKGATLTWARLDGALLRDSQLYAVNLRGAWLAGADLQRARLSGSTLYKAGLYGADLRGAFMRSYFGPDRSGEPVSYLPALLGADDSEEAASLADAICDNETQWPNMPPDFLFDPEARGVRYLGSEPLSPDQPS